jgi:NADPH:quinone reductase
MKRIVICYDGTGKIIIEEMQVPAVKRYEVLVKVHSSLISPGTEMGAVKSLRANPNPAVSLKPFGYGNAGTVIKTGKACKVLREGMRVACMGPGARHTDYAVVPQNLCVPIPDNVSFEEASFATLAATSLHAIRRADLEFGENVLVAGLGIIGNIAGQIACASGCHTLGTDLLPLRRTIAKKVGFDRVLSPERENIDTVCKEFTHSNGIDCAFLCLGGEGTAIFNQIVQVMKKAPDTHSMGRIIIPGGCEITTRFAATLGNLDIRSSARTGPGYHDPEYERGKNYTRVFVPWTTGRNLEEVIRAVEEGKIRVKPLITHQFPLQEAPKACEHLIAQPEKSLGVILHP